MPRDIHIKRVYEPPAAGDGLRVLIDRLWPRGVRKADAAIGRWCKDLAPSPELRRWFDHRPERFERFADRYRRELDDRGDMIDELLGSDQDAPLTLVYAARDPIHNHAVVLRDYLVRGAIQ